MFGSHEVSVIQVNDQLIIFIFIYINTISVDCFHRDYTPELELEFLEYKSVVVSGNLPSQNGKYGLYCAVIVKQVDEKTRGKVSINELLRENVL